MLMMLPLEALQPAAWNRGVVGLGDLGDLVASIKAKGILQPLVVRPNGRGPSAEPAYQIVCGHRRHAAAVEAGLAEVPAIVRELDDQAALEASIIENAQRADVHPLEEADGFRLLHDQHKLSIDDIAAKVGKSKAYVYGRLKLTALIAPARKAFLKGSLSPSVALLLARIPDGLQKAALAELCPTWRTEPMAFRDATRLVQDRFMLRLAGAPFPPADADLVPRAGACGPCPKRTGNAPDLFGDVSSADVCTDPACYRAKADAAWARRTAAAKATGQTVLPDAATKKLFPYGDRLAYDAAYIDLAQQDAQDPKDRTFKQLLGPHAPLPVLARDPEGRVHELVPKKDLAQALKAAGHDPRTRASSGVAEDRRRQREAQARGRIRTETTRRAIGRILEKAAKRAVDLSWWRFVLTHLLEASWHDTLTDIADRRGLVVEKRGPTKGGGASLARKADATRKLVDTLDLKGVQGLLLELVVTRGAATSWRSVYGDALRAAAKRYGVDLRAIERELTIEEKAKKASKGKKNAKGTKSDQTAPKAARGRQVCRGCGCTNAAACATPTGPCSWVERDLCSNCAGDRAGAAAVAEEWADTAAAIGGDPRGGADEADRAPATKKAKAPPPAARAETAAGANRHQNAPKRTTPVPTSARTRAKAKRAGRGK